MASRILQPRLLILELAATRPSAVHHPAVGRDVAFHRVLAAPELLAMRLSPQPNDRKCSIASTASNFIISARGFPCPRAVASVFQAA